MSSCNIYPSNEAAEATEAAASQVAIQLDEQGYEWKTETEGQRWYRTAGTEENWIRYEG